MQIECVNHREVEKDIQKTHKHTHSGIGKKLRTRTNFTYHQHLKSMNHHNTWTQWWLGSQVLSPQAQHCIFLVVIHEMHILSMVIIQSRQIFLKSFMLKLRQMENSHFHSFFKIFEILNFFWFFLKGLVLNAQTNSDIEKCELPVNDVKQLIVRKIEILIFISPKCKGYRRVFRASSLESWVPSAGIQFK